MNAKNRKLLNQDWGAPRFLSNAEKLRHAEKCKAQISERASVARRHTLHELRAQVRIMHFDQGKTAAEIATALKQDLQEIKILIGKMKV